MAIFLKFGQNLKIGSTFTKMVLGSPIMAKNQLWVISEKMWNFDLGPIFHFLAQNGRFWPKMAIFGQIFGRFFVHKMVKKQNKQNSSYRILVGIICKDSTSNIFLEVTHSWFLAIIGLPNTILVKVDPILKFWPNFHQIAIFAENPP